MNHFGTQFRLSIFGESHGKGVGIVVDGCPAGISIQESDFELDLSRRRSGALGTTTRNEKDAITILSGVLNQKTTGAPITLFFENCDTKSTDYAPFNAIPRPGHADFVASKKWNGFNDNRGGGHFSGRLTLGLVAAGVIAKKIISPIRYMTGENSSRAPPLMALPLLKSGNPPLSWVKTPKSVWMNSGLSGFRSFSPTLNQARENNETNETKIRPHYT
jgi:hypothetical protein